MDKEGHPVEFSSEKISEKKQPDFFVASNEKAARRARFSLGAILGRIGKSFKFIGVKLLNYIKHPFRGKHKIATILLFVAIVIVVVLIVLNLTVWQKQNKDTTPLSDEEAEKWGMELANIAGEGSKLSDDDFRSYYANLIEAQKREPKAIDLSTIYAEELARRGYVDLSLSLLKTLDIDDMGCFQIERYYSAYALAYIVLNNGTETSDSDHYNNLASDQEEFCQTGEWPSSEGLEEVDPDDITSPNDEESQNAE